MLQSNRFWIFFITVFLLATNRYFDWYSGIDFLTAHDADSYLAIAKAAPGFPFAGIPFHFAQRFVAPYLVGCFAKITSIEYETAFGVFSAICGILIFLTLYRILIRFGLKVFGLSICLALFALNPYTYRYYMIVPGLLDDLVFVWGTSVIVLALISLRPVMLILGLTISMLGRQTGLMLLPGIMLWIWMGQKWKTRIELSQKRLALALGCAFLCVGIYQLVSVVGAPFSQGPKSNLWHILNLFEWMGSSDFSALKLAEYTLRILLPFSIVSSGILGVFLKTKKKMVSDWIPFLSCLLMGFGSAMQPFLSGPHLTGKSATRLAALGLLPVVVAFAMVLSQNDIQLRARRILAFMVLLLLGSFHHMYSIVGPPSVATFVVLELSVALVFGYLFSVSTRSFTLKV